MERDNEQQERRKRYEKKSAKKASSADRSREATDGRGGVRRSERRKMERSNMVRFEGWAAAERERRRQMA